MLSNEELIEKIMKVVDEWESTEKSDFIRERLLPCLGITELVATIASQPSMGDIEVSHRFAVGEIVLHEDGQYECKVIEQLFPITHNNPSYKLKDLKDGTMFQEYESYLIANE